MSTGGPTPKAVHGSEHGHGHGEPALPASARLRRLLIAVMVPIVLLDLVLIAVLWPSGKASGDRLSSPAGARALIASTVIDRQLAPCSFTVPGNEDPLDCQVVKIRVRGGKDRGKVASFELSAASGIRLRPGDRIYVERFDAPGADGTNETRYLFYDFQRERPLLLLVLVFFITVIAIGRGHGFRALVALGLSLLMLGKFMLPAILDGHDPLLVALVGSAAVMFIALYVSHGVSARTTTAVIGTLASLAITGVLATVAVGAARFTGLATEEANYVGATAGQVDLRGLLLAGIIIGALGVLDDVTVTQASAVWELHQADPTAGFWGTFRAAHRIGRDHIASVVNTLVLAYAGASLPLLLLFTQAGTPLGEVFNGEPVATEIVRMLAGSIGLVAAVPITTALTVLVVTVDNDPLRRADIGHRPRDRPDHVARRRQWQPPKKEREFFDSEP